MEHYYDTNSVMSFHESEGQVINTLFPMQYCIETKIIEFVQYLLDIN